MKDQKTLYSDLNLGVIDDSGEVTPPAGKSLPSASLFAQFEGTDGPTTSNSVCTWADKTTGSHDMTLTLTNTETAPTNITDGNAVVLGSTGRRVFGSVLNSTLDPTEGYSVNLLMDYTATASGKTYGDVLYTLLRSYESDSNTYMHYHRYCITKRGDASYDKTGQCTMGKTEGSVSQTKYTSSALGTNLSGIHLYTIVVATNGTATVYVDGVSKGTLGNSQNLYSSGQTPNFGFFDYYGSDNNWAFYGKCYAVSVYGKVLDSSEIEQCVAYYAEHYNNYNPGE